METPLTIDLNEIRPEILVKIQFVKTKKIQQI